MAILKITIGDSEFFMSTSKDFMLQVAVREQTMEGMMALINDSEKGDWSQGEKIKAIRGFMNRYPFINIYDAKQIFEIWEKLGCMVRK